MQRSTGHTTITMRKLALILAALSLAAAACGGSISENVAEEIIERGIEAEGGGDVDIDLDSGQVSIEGPEGESISIGGGEVPDEITVPIPDGGSVISTFVSSGDASVGLSYPRSEFEALVAFYDDWVSGQSDEYSRNESSFTSDDGTVRNVGWYSGGENQTNISVTDCYTADGDGLDGACLNIVESS
jgi:hypothetical protein